MRVASCSPYWLLTNGLDTHKAAFGASAHAHPRTGLAGQLRLDPRPGVEAPGVVIFYRRLFDRLSEKEFIMSTGEVFLTIAMMCVAVILAMYIYGIWKHFRPITIYDYQAGLLYKRGKYTRTLGAGRYWKLTSATNIVVEDMRARSLVVAGQEMLTSDNLSIKSSAIISYRITDPRKVHEHFSDHYSDLYTFIQIALRKAVATRTLEEILLSHAEIDAELRSTMDGQAGRLGIEISQIMLRDLMLAADTKRAYADLFKAKKEGEAALERARGETAALRSLANGARTLKNNPALFNLRLLQLISDPSAKGATVVLNTSGEPHDPNALNVEDES